MPIENMLLANLPSDESKRLQPLLEPVYLDTEQVLIQADEPGDYRMTRHGEMLKCPWHGWEFDIRTGQSWVDPRKTYVRRYGVTVETGAELQEGPYVAETFPVHIEDSYVIVEA